MISIAISLPRATRGPDRRTASVLLVTSIAGVAWLVSIGLELTGNAAVLHHHALIQSGELPLWLGIPLFLVAWQVMVAAMMLPASLRAVGVVAGSRFVARPATAILGFLAAYALVWSGFGLAAFVGDVGLHALVAASPILASHLWIIPAATLAGAGAYQLVPWRLAALEACRHPARRVAVSGRDRGQSDAAAVDLMAGFQVGIAHGLDCVASSWALMLLMFAVGVANLAWMAALAGIMAFEALAPNGRSAGQAFGILLLVVAALVATGMPAGF